ncbi:collagen binding domain-containing protein [Streptococcus saliviloxodontae]
MTTFVFVFSFLTLTTVVKADDVSSNISSLTVSSGDINDGGKTTVRFTFDEHSQKIKSGDVINVTWQNSGTVYGSGFSKQINLDIQGKHVGDMIITDGRATVTFNSNIEGLQNINGWGEFEIQARNLTDTSDEHTGSFDITGGNQTVRVNVTKGKSGTGGVFYYKTGDMLPTDTDHVRWFLNINNNKAYVDDVVRVEDNIQSGQTLDLSSFYITVSGQRNEVYSGESAGTDFAADFPGSSIYTDAVTGRISVYIPREWASLNSISIMYLTKVDNVKQAAFDNHSKAWYQENGKDAVNGDEFNFSVANVRANGGANGDGTTTTTESTTEAPTTTTTESTTEEPTTTTTESTTESTTTTTESTTEEPTTTTTESTTEEPTTTTTESTTESTTTTTESTTEASTTTTTESTTESTTTTTESTTEAPTTESTTESTTTTTESTTEASTTTTTESTTEEPTTTTTESTTEEPTTTTTESTTESTTKARTVVPSKGGSNHTGTPLTKAKDAIKAALPSTGDSSTLWLSLLGIVLLISVASISFYVKWK